MIFLKLKIDEVTIKWIGCADRRKQHYWISKEDTSSLTVSIPTVSIEGLILLCMIDAMEG